MQTLVRNMIALTLGVVLGGVVNMAVISIGPSLIALPEGVNINDPESLKAGIHLFETKHFAIPWLAHALGTFFGALVASLIALSYRWQLALTVGVVYLAGGIAASMMIPAPSWFVATDLVFAYLPMAWLAYCLAKKIKSDHNPTSS